MQSLRTYEQGLIWSDVSFSDDDGAHEAEAFLQWHSTGRRRKSLSPPPSTIKPACKLNPRSKSKRWPNSSNRLHCIHILKAVDLDNLVEDDCNDQKEKKNLIVPLLRSSEAPSSWSQRSCKERAENNFFSKVGWTCININICSAEAMYKTAWKKLCNSTYKSKTYNFSLRSASYCNTTKSKINTGRTFFSRWRKELVTEHKTTHKNSGFKDYSGQTIEPHDIKNLGWHSCDEFFHVAVGHDWPGRDDGALEVSNGIKLPSMLI